MSEALSDVDAAATTTETEAVVEAMVHPQAVDFFVHAIGLDVRFQLLSQQEAVNLSNRIFHSYWHYVNVMASRDSFSTGKIDLETPIEDIELKSGARAMLRHQETCLIQSRHYLSGVDIGTLTQKYYPPAPGSSRIAARRLLAQNIRTTAGGIAHLSRTQYGGNLLGTIINQWKLDDPDSLPTIFASSQTGEEPTLTLESYDGQLPRRGPNQHLGIVVIARSVADSPFQRQVSIPATQPDRREREPWSADGDSTQSRTYHRTEATAIPAVATAGASRDDILAARQRRIADMQNRSRRMQRVTKRSSQRPSDNGTAPPSQ